MHALFKNEKDCMHMVEHIYSDILESAAIAGVVLYNNHKLRKEALRMNSEVHVDINDAEKTPDQEVQIALLPPKDDK